jgi:hypothetical protein
MKLFVGLLASAGVLVSAAAADAQVLVPYRVGAGATVLVSDFREPYAAMPPEMAPPPRYGMEILPPREVFRIVREMGFQPLGAPQQRGMVYTLSAINEDGEDGRVVIDARNGRILRFMPAYVRGRMGDEISTSYGPEGRYPPEDAPPYVRDDRPAPPFVRDNTYAPRPSAALPNEALPHVASRTPSVPLPKAPPRAVATPAKPVAPAPAVAVAPPATPPAAAPVQQAVVGLKPDAVRVIPLNATPVAAPAVTAPVAPTVAAPPVEAKPAAPADQPTQPMPPVQGLE